MKIHLISVGNKMPDWINSGVNTYLKRTPWDINLVEINPGKRPQNYSPLDAIKQEEHAISKYLEKLGPDKLIVSLAIDGTNLSTEELSTKIKLWGNYNKHICFLIGGPDGLSRKFISQSHFAWSLSRLTLPHMLARVVVTEQLYRAWSVLTRHPYHK